MKAIIVGIGSSLLLSTFSATAAAADSEPTNFRVGVTSTALDVSPSAPSFPDSSQRGFGLYAEFPQSNHAASRFIWYRIHDDDQDVTGFETQLMWGWGLAQPGFRLYTGPAWHRDKVLIQRTAGSHTGIFNGWGWQIGTGYQLGPVILDVAATFRDDQDYRNENRRAGISGERPNVWLTNAMISYRF
ncbi:hypothetical protein [Oceanobacter mangrovi]|uniref:hypothetical protein n=1 Tax=Oceanobacter mangrovi TaxID=2862510 RepID=UPI001C8D04FB|nr:hypothetical protein [Oceanobacter mangrovi]